MANYYGKQGPRFLLIKESGSKTTYDLPAPQEYSSNNWSLVQNQNRDINNILRTDELKYIYEGTLTWSPIADNDTLMSELISICNWRVSEKRRIRFYPHRDKTLIYFDVIVTAGTPGYFSKVPYDSFTITVISERYLDKIPDPDGATAVEIGNEIEIE